MTSLPPLRCSADGLFDAESENAGIIPRTVKRIFAKMNEKKKAWTEGEFDYCVKVSFLEIYNEKLDDLLSTDPSYFESQSTAASAAFAGATKAAAKAPGSKAGVPGAAATSEDLEGDNEKNQRLQIMEDKDGIRVAGLLEHQVYSPKEVFALLARGVQKRATAETKCNAASSRSHCVFTIHISMKESFNGKVSIVACACTCTSARRKVMADSPGAFACAASCLQLLSLSERAQ